MTTNLPATTSFSIPTPLRPDVEKRLRSWTSYLKLPSSTGRYLSAADMPSDDQRAALQRRSMQIQSWRQPIAENELRSQLQATLGMLKGPKLSEQEVEFELDIFRSVLADLPAFAIIAACRDFLTGRRGDGWKPVPPDLRLAALDHVAPIAREQLQIEAVIEAQPEPERTSAENRKATADMIRSLLPSMREAGAKAEAERTGQKLAAPVKREDPHETLARLREMADATRDTPITVSPTLARLIRAAQTDTAASAAQDRRAAA